MAIDENRIDAFMSRAIGELVLEARPCRMSAAANARAARRVALAALLVAILPGLTQATISIPRAVIACGGIGGVSASHSIRSTLGQAITGSASSQHYSVGSGYWQGQNEPSAAPETPSLPLRYALGEPRPNPTTRSTWISYEVPVPGGAIRIEIFDVGGRLIRTLVDRVEQPGRWGSVWDGRDEQGREAFSGVYLCRLQARNAHEIRKIVWAR